ncbi:MAG TPA: AAA family ATPase [Pyrinomonadaceae bacterium]
MFELLHPRSRGQNFLIGPNFGYNHAGYECGIWFFFSGKKKCYFNSSVTIHAITPFREKKSMIIVIAGAPATGKTTLAKELSHYLKVLFDDVVFNLEIDQIRNFVLGDVNHFDEKGSIWFSLLVAIVEHLKKEQKNIIVEGLFYDIECLNYFKDLETETKFILLKTPIDVCLERNRNRTKVLPTSEVLDLFDIERPDYVFEIDSSDSVKETLDKVLEFLQLNKEGH